MARNTSVYNATRKQMWLVQAVLAGRKIILSRKGIFSCAIEDLITTGQRSFLTETDPDKLRIGDIWWLRLRGDDTVYSIGTLNIINIDFSGQADYPPALCRNVAEAVRKRKYQTKQFIDYLKTCREEEQRNAKQNSDNGEQASRYSFREELEAPLVPVTDGSLSEKNIRPPLDIFFGKSYPPEEHREPVTAVQNDAQDTVGGAIVSQALCENNVVYISGPPGTGKTTTLRSVLISAFLNDRTVLFTSKNNAAIDAAYRQIVQFFAVDSGDPEIPVPVLRCGNKEVLEICYRTTVRQYFNRAEKFLKRAEDLSEPDNDPKTLFYKTDMEEIRKRAAQRIVRSILSLDRVFPDWREWKEDTVNRKLFFRYQRNIRTLLSAFPIVFSTCDSLPILCSPDPEHPPFDIVIIDEASQCPMTDGLLGVLRAKTLVLSGDMNQLPPVSTMSEGTDEKSRSNREIDNTYRYTDKSLYGIYKANDPYAVCENRYFRLLNHYRCVPDIIRFSNVRYYDSQLCCRKASQPDPALSLVELTCREDNGETELAVVMDLIRRLVGSKLNGKEVTEEDIAVISPFRKNHIDRLKELLGNRYRKVHAGTIHEFQGSEFRIVIMSTGLKPYQKKAYGKLIHKNRQLINVGMTRAMEKFILVNNYPLMDTYSKACRKKKKKKEAAEDSRPLWEIASVDDLVALHDYVKTYSTDIRIISEPVALDAAEAPANHILTAESFIRRLIDNRTFSYSGTKPEMVRINTDGIADREGSALKLMSGNTDICMFEVTGTDGSASLKKQCTTQKIPYILLEEGAPFCDEQIIDTVFSVLERNPLNEGRQCYCGSPWLMRLFLHAQEEEMPDQDQDIYCRFRDREGNPAELTWYDKCLMDVIYTCYRRKDKTVSAERLYQMMSGDYTKRLTKTSARELRSSIARLEETAVTLTFRRPITMYSAHEVTFEGPLLKLPAKSETKYDLSEFDLKTCLPLYAAAEERMNIYAAEERFLRIDPESDAFKEMRKEKTAVPNSAFLISRYIYSRVSSLIQSTNPRGWNFWFNDILLFDSASGKEEGVLRKLGFETSGDTQSGRNRRSDLRRYISCLMRWYEECGLIRSHYYSGSSTERLYLSFETQLHCLNETEFSKYVYNKENILSGLEEEIIRLDRGTAAEILVRKFRMGETLDHIHKSMVRNRITRCGSEWINGWGPERIARLVKWFAVQAGKYLVPMMEQAVFASETIAQTEVLLNDISGTHILQNSRMIALCTAEKGRPHIVLYLYGEKKEKGKEKGIQYTYPYIPSGCHANILLSVVPDETPEGCGNLFQNWESIRLASHRNLETLQGQIREGSRKAEQKYAAAEELDMHINNVIQAAEAGESREVIFAHAKKLSETFRVYKAEDDEVTNLIRKAMKCKPFQNPEVPLCWPTRIYTGPFDRNSGGWVINSDRETKDYLALYSVIQTLNINHMDIKTYLEEVYGIILEGILSGRSGREKKEKIEAGIRALADSMNE